MQVVCPSCEHPNNVAGDGPDRCVRCRTLLPRPEPASPAPPPEPPQPPRTATTPAAAAMEPPTAPAEATEAADHAAGASDGPGARDADSPPADLALPAEALRRVQSLEEQIKARPKGVAPYLQLERLYLDAGRRDLAIHVLKRCLLKADPKNVTVKARLDVLTRQERAVADPARVPASGEPAGADGAVPSHGPPAAEPILEGPRSAIPKPLKVAALVVAIAIQGWVVKRLWFPSAVPMIAGTFSAHHPVWSPDGEFVAFVKVENDMRLCLFEVDTGKIHDLAPASYGADVAWSPDGRYLAFTAQVWEIERPEDEDDWEALRALPAGPAVYLTDAEGSAPRRVALGTSPSWAPDGMNLAMLCASEDPEEPDALPCIVNTVTHSPSFLADVPARNVRYAPDGDKVLFELDGDAEAQLDAGAAYDAMLENIATNTSNLGEGERAMSREAEAQDLDPTRSLFELTSNIYVTNVAGGVRRLTTDGTCGGATFLPDGDVAYLHRDGATTRLLRIGTDGRSSPEPLLDAKLHVADPYAMTFTPDGARMVAPAVVDEANPGVALLMTHQQPIDLYAAKVGGSRTWRLVTPQTFKSGDFSIAPDGKTIAYEATNMETGISEIWRTRL